MEGSLKGLVVVINFPFSNLSDFKRRPSLVIADWAGADILLSQVTSIANKDEFAVELYDNDFNSGSLFKQSFIRPNKLFSADKNIILSRIGYIKAEKKRSI